jgi:hypothetical protein
VTRYDSGGTPAVSEKAVGANADGQVITPLEAVFDRKSVDRLHEKAEAEIRAPEPVHLDGLKPVVRRGGPGPGMLPAGDGTSIPMVPRMTRTIPAPHQRPRIAIDHHGKTWAYMQAGEVEPGDIVVDYGKIEKAWTWLEREYVMGQPVPVREWVVLENIAGVCRNVDPAEQLRVFRVHENS